MQKHILLLLVLASFRLKSSVAQTLFNGKERRIRNLTEGSERPLGEWNQMIIDCKEDQITD
ncbi:hypothetical protein [Arthrospiribacter ruber]|uniref:hypothetical protein n=1 Tax=Arthrospiribacter ruber TaxID=2487934 RepID=UPI0031B7FB6D